jgi:NADPH-dependent ferric siderophore reductase
LAKHQIERVRQEAVRCVLRVESARYITPRMLRIVFHCDDLHGFHSSSPDDYIRIVLPGKGGGQPVTRYFTPRAWDRDFGTLVLEFAMHPNGPAVDWARNAKVGDALEIESPPASTIVPDNFDWYLMVGDATAWPSIARRLESLRSGVPVRVVALVADDHEQQEFTSSANVRIDWIQTTGRPQQDASALRSVVEEDSLPMGDGFIWIAAEVSVARELYKCAVETLRHPKQWIKASAYWSEGHADARERIG